MSTLSAPALGSVIHSSRLAGSRRSCQPKPAEPYLLQPPARAIPCEEGGFISCKPHTGVTGHKACGPVWGLSRQESSADIRIRMPFARNVGDCKIVRSIP